MLLNLSISSLFASSLSNSPFFSSNNKYLINSCKFYRFFPIIFYQTQNLKVQDSYFTNTLSNAIFIDNQNYSDFDINNPPYNINDNDSVIFQRSSFNRPFAKNFEIRSKSSVLIIECLFNNIRALNNFMTINSIEITISGCCFSDITITTNPINPTDQESSLFALGSYDNKAKGNIKFNSNIATNAKSSYNFIRGDEINFDCLQCNFSFIIIDQYMFSFASADISFSESQITNSESVNIIISPIREGKLDIYSLYFIDNTIRPSSSSAYAIFSISCPDIVITNTVFEYFKTSENGKNCVLFASLEWKPQNCHVTIKNCFFDISLFLGNNYYYPHQATTDYINNSQIFETIPTTVVSMNPYLYQYYRAQCRIYLFPTQIFTQSDPFTKSDIFTPSDFFITASPSISPTSSCSPSMSPSPSTSPSPSPSLSPSVNAAYGIVGAVGTAVVSFGLSSLVWLSIRKCCIYDHDNYLHMDV